MLLVKNMDFFLILWKIVWQVMNTFVPYDTVTPPLSMYSKETCSPKYIQKFLKQHYF